MSGNNYGYAFWVTDSKTGQDSNSNLLITLDPGDNVCLSVCMAVRMRNSKTIARVDLIFFIQEVLCPWLGPQKRLSGSGRKKLLKGSSPLGDRTNYAIKVRHDIKRALSWKHALWRHSGIIASEGMFYHNPTQIYNPNLILTHFLTLIWVDCQKYSQSS